MLRYLHCQDFCELLETPNMRLTIFGSGYVGLVTGACMAEVGNHVLCVDIDEDKIKRLSNGDVPIYEPGLDTYIHRNQKAGSDGYYGL